ncbi:MAG TPA: bifunctional phosphoglucose/phosphomannose isomerase [Candidatus Acidoferrum sp.]|nr:bifunctional phosphoglucose/phosphomannose isomerase [Candidatus Acidoferrum sp.]
MLDNKNYVSQYDANDALGYAAKQPAQLSYSFGLSEADLGGPFANVVLAGMGGSALQGEFARTWPELSVPFMVCKTYTLPKFVDTKTLVIAASFSGNTEEVLSALADAEQKGAKIAVIAHGGKLAELAKQAGFLFAAVPDCPQPRMGVFYMYRALIEIFVAAKLVSREKIDELAGMQRLLEAATHNWATSMPADKNPAKQLAEHMVGKTPIIYAGPLMYPAAYKWKIDCNENAKNTSWTGQYSEFNHNEFIGWSSHPIEKPFAVLDLVSHFEHPQILKRFAVTDRLLSGLRPKAVTINAEGSSVLEHLLYLILLGDFATIYLAILNGNNPTPVDLVEKFKVELSK